MVGTFQAATVLGLSLFVPAGRCSTPGARPTPTCSGPCSSPSPPRWGSFFLFSRHIRIAQIFSAPEEVEEGLEEEEKEYVADGDGAPPPGGAGALTGRGGWPYKRALRKGTGEVAQSARARVS